MPGRTFTLSRPITTHGRNGPEEARTVELREPSGDDFGAAALPFRFVTTADGGSETIIDGPTLMVWLNRLSGQPGLIGQCHARDVQQMAMWLASELGPLEKNSA